MFHSFVDAIIQFITQNPNLSLFIVFLIAFIEALPILGTIFPGSITMTAIGTLLGSQILPTWPTISAAIVGAFVGDFLGYKLGLHYDHHLRKMWPFKKHPEWLTVGEAFFKKHGGKSIIIGRFIGPVRSTIPLIAGFMKVSLAVFLSAGFTSAVLWAALYILPGFLLGALSLELPAGKASQFLLVGAVIIIGLWFIFWFLQHFLRVISKRVDRFIKVIWDLLISHPRLKYIINLISNKTDPSDHLQLARLLLAVFCFLLFIVLAINVTMSGVSTKFNEPLFNLLQSFHTNDLNRFFTSFTLLADPKVLMATAVITSLYLLVVKRTVTGWYVLFVSFLSASSMVGMKHIFHIARPTGLVVINSGFSFPSGHMLLSVSILGFFAFTIAHQYKRVWYWIPYTLTTIVILLVGLSRLYLGAHWLTDVVGSALIGSVILLVTIIGYTHKHNQNTHLGKWWPVIYLSTLLLLTAAYSVKEFKKTISNAQPLYPKVQTVVQEWWQDPQYYVPKYYLNRFGIAIAPFNLQWEGSLEHIKTTLENNGWDELYHRLTLKALLQRLTNRSPEHHTPILTPLYHNTRPVLAMFKRVPDSDAIVELRVWQTNVSFSNTEELLWLGVVYFHVPGRKLLSDPYKNFFINYEGKDALQQLVPALHSWKSKIIQVENTQHNKYLDHLNWTGSVLLIRAHAPAKKVIKVVTLTGTS